MQLTVDEFEYLSDHGENGIIARTNGCGCCSETDWELQGREVAFITRYIANLHSEIATWENILARYAD